MNRSNAKHQRIRQRQSERAKAGGLPENEQSGQSARERAQVTRIKSGDLVYDVFDEPLGNDWPIRVLNLYREALSCLRRQSWQEAERLIQLALKLRPCDPRLRNNLGAALDGQGRRDEAIEIISKIHLEFPDYVFARTGLAKHYIRDGRLDEARSLLQPIRDSKRLHANELTALCISQIDLCVVDGSVSDAADWLDLLELVDPENPVLESKSAMLVKVCSGLKRFQADSEKRAMRKAARTKEKLAEPVQYSPQLNLPFE